VLPYVSTRPAFLGAESSSEAMDERDVDEGLARGVSEGEMSVEGAEEAGPESVVSKRCSGAACGGKAVVVAMSRCMRSSCKEEL
jgi:hypothetical protein